MSNPKKILFVSCAAGAGHKRAAEALCLTSRTNFPDIEARHIDIADYSNWMMKKSVFSGYHFLARYMPDLYGLLYAGTDSTAAAKFLNYFASFFQINTLKLNRYVQNFAPDRILCTHFLASALLKNFANEIPLDMLVTDYELNRIILDPLVRNFYAPTEEIAAEIRSLGRQSFPTGIPLHPEFMKDKNPSVTIKDFAINEGWPTILVMTGGNGLIDPGKIVKNIIANLTNINLVVISGKDNRRLYNKLNRLIVPKNINYRPLVFTTRVDELIRLADIVVTKPGGLTVTECLHLKKPLLLVSPIPGQEEANIRFIEQKNYGRLLADHNDVSDIIASILNGNLKFAEPNIPSDSALQILKKFLL
jgi:processive 1,2-diacylglycerol beta-glucosyltransferase